jgi:hypothetical protein
MENEKRSALELSLPESETHSNTVEQVNKSAGERGEAQPSKIPPPPPPHPPQSPFQQNEGIPPGVKGWSWGAFLLSLIWAIGNRVWIGLLVFVPIVGSIIMPFVLGFKGREWAWKTGRWTSVEAFNETQRKWSKWGVIVTIFFWCHWGFCTILHQENSLYAVPPK